VVFTRTSIICNLTGSVAKKLLQQLAEATRKEQVLYGNGNKSETASKRR
jgi:hypothetical protein